MGVVVLDKHNKISLADIPANPPKGFSKAVCDERQAAIGEELSRLQDSLWGARSHSLLIVLQGRDAAGKDGAIRRVMGAFNPRGVRVTSFGVPSREEAEHDFLWRVHNVAPRRGEVAIFNRSHYEEVLVTRVHKLVKRKAWKRRFEQINEFESMLASESTIVVKVFLHITRDEQRKRLLEREKDPAAAWKLNTDDWRDHDRWDEFSAAYEELLHKCSKPEAPWTIVPSNAKWYRNMVVAEAVLNALRPHKAHWDAVLAEKGAAGRAAITNYRRKK